MSRFENEWCAYRPPSSRAALRKAGVSRRALAGASYQPAVRGYHRLVGDAGQPVTPTQRILDVSSVVPEGSLIAGWAAAYAHGVSVLDGLDPFTLAPLPVPVLLPPGQHRRDTAAASYRQSRRPVKGTVILDLPVTTQWRTIVDLACCAPNLTEAVVAVDAFLAARLVTLDGLQRSLARTSARRGIGQLREAIALAQPGVRSPWESRLRTFAALEVGLTTLQPNRAVFDRAGRLLGIPDLLDIESGLVLEYDGASWQTERTHGHRDRAQHREDNEREERLERAGLVVVRAEKADLTEHRTALGRRIREAHADGLSRNRARDRWTIDEPEGWIGMPA